VSTIFMPLHDWLNLFPHFASPKYNYSVILERRHELKLTKARYQQGSIKRVERMKGYA